MRKTRRKPALKKASGNKKELPPFCKVFRQMQLILRKFAFKNTANDGALKVEFAFANIAGGVAGGQPLQKGVSTQRSAAQGEGFPPLFFCSFTPALKFTILYLFDFACTPLWKGKPHNQFYF